MAGEGKEGGVGKTMTRTRRVVWILEPNSTRVLSFNAVKADAVSRQPVMIPKESSYTSSGMDTLAVVMGATGKQGGHVVAALLNHTKKRTTGRPLLRILTEDLGIHPARLITTAQAFERLDWGAVEKPKSPLHFSLRMFKSATEPPAFVLHHEGPEIQISYSTRNTRRVQNHSNDSGNQSTVQTTEEPERETQQGEFLSDRVR
ncbi:uncharacterized protein BT62DRAFT_997614 [Guyanagaster necrorhizus]|uniref:Uncharacterized protein n=1 Tax=Guyanagaster necrorhizus TaxID=856835 RepID=A0A9P7VIJ4_9AGAR|nr:uncharacterized protein BT62DRAFT_997614 [Guyanagaster necrorhizus MCA 3950]KAG7440681.1 hypothetical protein BT62DRAFT_997614 [Guyanagaster necrorhizus MCA 3950]